MKTLPFMKVSHLDVGNEPRKLSKDNTKIVTLNKTATSKQSLPKAPIVSEPITPFTKNTDETGAQTTDAQAMKEVDTSKNVR